MRLSLKTSVLFTRAKPAAGAGEVIAWWEARRPIYNLLVGSAGLFSCAVVAIDAIARSYLYHEPVGGPEPPIFVVIWIVIYAVGANFCYTGGWLAELVMRRILAAESDGLAILGFKCGLAFAVLLTLFPGIVFGVFGLIAAWPHIFGTG
jgi:hypothetical protein